MITDKTKAYLRGSLSSAPLVLSALLQDTPEDCYDVKVEADRFTLREVVAHLADWEDIFHGRILQLLNDENPLLVGIDEGQWSIDHDHAHADFADSLRKYAEARKSTISTIDKLTTAQWLRPGRHTETGDTTVTDQLVHMSAHDGYHLEQVVEWRRHLAGLHKSDTAENVVTQASRTELSRREIPGTGLEAALFLLALPPGGEASPHKHPGIGVGYVLEGLYESQYEGEELKQCKAGDAIYDLAETPHLIARNGSADEPLRFIMTFVVEKGAPTNLLL